MPIQTTAPPQRHHEVLCGTQATALRDQPAVPAQDGAGRDKPVHPQPRGQDPDQHGEDSPVGPDHPGPRPGAPQDGDLMPQHEQPGVPGRRGAAEQDQPAAGPGEHQVEQADRHGRPSCPARAASVVPAQEVCRLLTPHRSPAPRSSCSSHHLPREPEASEH